MRLLACGVAALAMGFAIPASAQDAGGATVSGLSGDLGQVVVVRGADTYSLQAGDQLLPGDRIITRRGGSVTLDGAGCSRSLSGLQSITVGSDFCSVNIASVNAQGSVVTGSGLAAAPATLPVIGGIIAGGILIAATEDDDPTSP